MTTRRGREAALRIQLLQEEFTPDELADGLALVGAAKGEDLIEFLSRRTSRPSNSNRARSTAVRADRMTDIFPSLKRDEPEKYRIIRAFEKQLRDGSVLPTLDSCRAFGKDLSKDFEAGKSRRDCISRLVAILSTMNVDDVQAVISRAPSYIDTDSPEPYRRLATHIISGGTSR